MAVEVDQPDLAEGVAGAGEGAGQLGAAAAGDEGPLAGADPLGDGGADRPRAGQHVV